MRIRPDELPRRLEGNLASVYIISGDEPLQVGEAADAIRKAARDQNYTERDILEANSKFDWNELTAEADALSLFATKRIIDLRIPNGKPGKNGSSTLVEYCERPPEDTLLLITLPKLERTQLNSKWLKALESQGVLIQIWPVEGNRLFPWIEQRMRKRGLVPGPDVVQILSEQIEGNLLAASQEIEKLLLLHGPGSISAEQLNEAVSDSARFDVFGLVDCALSGDTARCTRILRGLRAEGTAAPVVLWALARETRTLHAIARELNQGRNIQQAMATQRGIWEKRKPLVSRGVQRLTLTQWSNLIRLCGKTDMAIKGRSKHDPWRLLEQITTQLSGVHLAI